MKKPSISSKSLDAAFERLEKLSKVQRLLISILSFLLLVGVVGWFVIFPKYEKSNSLSAELKQLEKDLRIANTKAAALPKLRKDLKAAEERFLLAGRALPDSEEIPSLLASISNSGQDAGLEFNLFQPQAEVKKEFYADIPVSIQVQGTYHNIGTFFDRVSNLPRIVNIQNIRIKPISGDIDKLNASFTAVTYKFVEEDPNKPKKQKKKK